MIRIEIDAPYQAETQLVKKINPKTGSLVKTKIFSNPRNIIRTFSDAGLQIRKKGTDEIYESGEAFDLEGSIPQYEETDLPVKASEVNYEI